MFIVNWPASKAVAVICLILLLSPSVVWSAMTQNLWLPGSYHKLMPELRKGAEKLQATERCAKVLEGKLHNSTQDEGRATFFFICRDSERKTFPVLMDANTLELDFPLTPEPTPRDLAAERRARIQQAWQQCESSFVRETRFMNKMTILTQGQPKPQTDEDGSVAFVIDFDAQNLHSQPLHYRAYCTSKDDGALPEMSIQPRRSAALGEIISIH